jgi:hypothetical protein
VKNSAFHPFEIPSSQIQIGRVGPKLQDFAIHRLVDLEVFLLEKSPTRFSRLEVEFLRKVYFVHGSGMEVAHMHKRNKRPPCRKIVLKLPDLDHAKSAVLNSLSSPHSRRNYKFAMEQFISRYVPSLDLR